MQQQKQAAQLLIADPPYNFNQKYDAINDKKSRSEYLAWTKQWLTAAAGATTKEGSIWIFAPDEWVSEIDVMAKSEFKLHKRNHVVWYFTFGQAQQKKFTRSHCHLLWFTKHSTKFTFNPQRVPSARQAIYKDKRAKSAGKVPDDTWVLHRSKLEPLFTPDSDTWLMSRVCGTFKERQKQSPNQLPVELVERIVLSCSNPGDLVLDPFAGTGSVGVACVKHERQYQGYDLSEKCVALARERISQVQ